MALIKCSECGQMVSDKAINCPKCGNHIVTTEQSLKRNEPNSKKWIIIIVLAIVIVGAGAAAYMLLLKDADNTTVENTAEPQSKSDSSLSDLQILGFENGIKQMDVRSESELSYQYMFDKDGMLSKCMTNDEGGSTTYMFTNGKLTSAQADWHEPFDDESGIEKHTWKYEYQKDGDNHDIVYQIEEAINEKKQFAEIFYNNSGRVVSIKTEYHKKDISYGDENKPCNQEGYYTLIGLELLNMPIVNNELEDEPNEDGEYKWLKKDVFVKIVEKW